jgi:hypothetical protein
LAKDLLAVAELQEERFSKLYNSVQRKALICLVSHITPEKLYEIEESLLMPWIQERATHLPRSEFVSDWAARLFWGWKGQWEYNGIRASVAENNTIEWVITNNSVLEQLRTVVACLSDAEIKKMHETHEPLQIMSSLKMKKFALKSQNDVERRHRELDLAKQGQDLRKRAYEAQFEVPISREKRENEPGSERVLTLNDLDWKKAGQYSRVPPQPRPDEYNSLRYGVNNGFNSSFWMY